MFAEHRSFDIIYIYTSFTKANSMGNSKVLRRGISTSIRESPYSNMDYPAPKGIPCYVIAQPFFYEITNITTLSSSVFILLQKPPKSNKSIHYDNYDDNNTTR